MVGVAALIVERAVRVTEVMILRDAAKGLGVSKEQEATHRERSRDARHDRAHHFRREVHGDVATEDDIERVRLPEQGVVIEEVALLEGDGGAHFVV